MLPSISVVLAVRNERAMLPRLLDQLTKQNYPADRFEILVVDGHSSDGTAELIRRRYAKNPVPVRVLENPGATVAAARNAAIGVASGDVLLFLDGNCAIRSRNLLEDTAAILDRTGAACLCFPQPLAAPPATHTAEVIAQTRNIWLLKGRLPATGDLKQAGFVDPVCCGSAYLRRVFYRVGLFDEALDACADMEFNTRVRKAGYRAWSDPRLAVEFAPQPSLRALFEQMVRYGRGRRRLMQRHPDCFSGRDLTPLGVMAALLLAALAWAFMPAVAATVATIPAAFCLVALLAATIQIFVMYGFESACKAPLIFATAYAGMAAGLLGEIFARAKRAEPATEADLLFTGPELLPAEHADRAA